MFFFKNRKSRKQLLQEIEKLEMELELQKGYRFEAEKKNIVTLGATCISHRKCEDVKDVKKFLCKELSEQLLPYIFFEEYPYVDGYICDEAKYVATIKVLEK